MTDVVFVVGCKTKQQMNKLRQHKEIGAVPVDSSNARLCCSHSRRETERGKDCMETHWLNGVYNPVIDFEPDSPLPSILGKVPNGSKGYLVRLSCGVCVKSDPPCSEERRGRTDLKS